MVGDSWGVGEWDYNAHITGPGIGQYLSLTHSVANFSKGGTSNSYSLIVLEDLLERFKPRNNDHHCDDIFYWIVTDPTRCVENVSTLVNTGNGFKKEIENLLHKSFNSFNQLAIKHNITINLIGGLCDIDKTIENQYSNLKVAVPSWVKLYKPDHVPSIFCMNSLTDIGKLIKSNSDEMKEWLELTEIAKWNNHPDRHQHRILRDYLFPEFKQYF